MKEEEWRLDVRGTHSYVTQTTCVAVPNRLDTSHTLQLSAQTTRSDGIATHAPTLVHMSLLLKLLGGTARSLYFINKT
jgi:hypothetical protein